MHLNRINLVIIICIIASLLYWYAERTDLATECFAFSGENLLKGRLWTLISALFLHADPTHLLGNMVFLFVFGNTLEKELKAKKTFLAFFVGGIVTSLLGVFFYEPATFLIGASAAIFTLTAIVMLTKPLKFSFLFLMPQGLVAIIYFTYNLFAVYFGMQGNIAYISHVIGFLIGMSLGMAWSKEWVKNLLITIGLLLIYLFLIIFVIPYILQMFSLTIRVARVQK
jgi:membrane associated rhomboid family serine protease